MSLAERRVGDDWSCEAGLQALESRRPPARAAAPAGSKKRAAGDRPAVGPGRSKGVRRAARHSGRVVATPCELERHELRIGQLAVTLQRRVRGIAPSRPPEESTPAAHRADELDASTDTTGLDLWTPAVWLCVSFLQSGRGQRLVARDRSLRVLELGAGLGAAGLLVAQCVGSRATSLCLTDGADCVLPLLQHNASLNPLQSGGSIFTGRLRFGDDEDASQVLAATMGRWSTGDQPPPPLLVIGCEVLYCRALVLPLLRTLRQLLCHAGRQRRSIALLSHTVRRAIFAGPDGQLMREPTDTVLDTFLQAAAEPQGDAVGEAAEWSACKLEVRLLASTHGSGAATIVGGDAAPAAAAAVAKATGAKKQLSKQEQQEEQQEEVRLYALVASSHRATRSQERHKISQCS